MWHKTFKIKIKNHNIDVICYYDVTDDGYGQICFRTMLNETLITFEILIDDSDGDRDLAYSLIDNFPIKTLREKILLLAFDNGAID